jgi:hypothetical protein
MRNSLPFFVIDTAVVVIGYFGSLSWAKTTDYWIDENGKLDSSANAFLMKMWGGIGLFGVACYFLTK